MEILLSPLTIMGLVFITAPLIAILPAVLFGWFYLKTKKGINLIVALLWGAYAIYEYAMKLNFLCSGGCNIRVDLLLLYPLLLMTTIFAVISTIRWYKNV
jgi:hypothetical protein